MRRSTRSAFCLRDSFAGLRPVLIHSSACAQGAPLALTRSPLACNARRSFFQRVLPSHLSLCISLLLLGTLAPIATAQTVDDQTNPPTESATNVPPTFNPRLGIRYTTEGAGFNPFVGFEGFVPLLQSPGNNLTFLEGRLLLSTNNSTLGGNVLLGHRFYSSSSDRITGGYISYDNRETGRSFFNQLGLGLENLGEDWDIRANAYIPIGNTRQQFSETLANIFFQQNFLQFERVRQFEAAMTGFDAEVGARLLRLGEDGYLRGYAGVYYYDAEGSKNAWGWRARVVARPNDYLGLSLSVQDDRLFDTRVIFGIALNFPGTAPTPRQSRSALNRMGESVERQASITVDEQFIADSVAAINPSTGQPFRFLHVNLGNGSGGGTFEAPFGTVQDALNVTQPNDIVYVQQGTNPGIPAFTLPNGVALLSTGPVQRIHTVQRAGVVLPLSGTGVLPSVTGTVTLGNDNTLSGFAIALPAITPESSGTGIKGTNISNPTIRDNTITNAANQGIQLDNASGTVTISNNTLSNINGDGIRVSTSGNTQTQLLIDSNTITRDVNEFGFTGIKLVVGDDSVTTATISNNNIANSVFRGIKIDALGNSQTRLSIETNTITGSQFNGITITADENAKIATSVRFNTLTGNNVASAFGGGGLDVQTNSNASMCLQLLNNNSTSNNGSDFNLANNNVGVSTFQVEDTLSTNTGTVTQNPTPSDFPNVPRGTCGFP